jgi:histone H3/H4
MAYNNSVLSQLLKLLPRHDFERLANRYDGKRRSDALSRWSQSVDDPLATVFEVKASVGIHATQECASHTSGDAVVVRRVFQ